MFGNSHVEYSVRNSKIWQPTKQVLNSEFIKDERSDSQDFEVQKFAKI